MKIKHSVFEGINNCGDFIRWANKLSKAKLVEGMEFKVFNEVLDLNEFTFRPEEENPYSHLCINYLGGELFGTYISKFSTNIPLKINLDARNNFVTNGQFETKMSISPKCVSPFDADDMWYKGYSNLDFFSYSYSREFANLISRIVINNQVNKIPVHYIVVHIDRKDIEQSFSFTIKLREFSEKDWEFAKSDIEEVKKLDMNSIQYETSDH